MDKRSIFSLLLCWDQIRWCANKNVGGIWIRRTGCRTGTGTLLQQRRTKTTSRIRSENETQVSLSKPFKNGSVTQLPTFKDLILYIRLVNHEICARAVFPTHIRLYRSIERITVRKTVNCSFCIRGIHSRLPPAQPVHVLPIQ